MRNVIVTGGTGALGRKVADAFLDAGERVVVPWIVKDEREEIAAAKASALDSGKLVLVEADVAEDSGAAEVARAAGEVDVLVNGVGGFGGGTPVAETDLELWDHLYRINVRTAVAMSRAVIPGMQARGAGSILLVASQAARDCPAGIAAYSAAKAGVIALVQSLHNELGASGVRVNAVVPTTIDTPANRAGMPDADFSTWTPPAEIARVLLWLASDNAATVRGALVPV
jgi:NAD(P)-dependent dehydrogenase (short-subunit alcohol dehydrogenase family)